MFHSSPLRGKLAVDDLEDKLKARANRLYHPMSSPIAQRTPSLPSRLKTKQDEIRRLHRQARLALGREKITDTEDWQKQLKELKEQADALDIDPDILAEEEIQLTQEHEYENQYEEYLEEQLEEQLEDYIADAELELEQQLKDMQLDDFPTEKGSEMNRPRA